MTKRKTNTNAKSKSKSVSKSMIRTLDEESEIEERTNETVQ